MSSSHLRFVVCSAVLALLAGCGSSKTSSSGGGGGGGGGTSNPTTVTYSFIDGAQPLVFAAQIGAGSYASQTLASGKVTLTIPSGETNFAVAYVCPSPYGNDPTFNVEYIKESSISDGTSYYGYCYGPGNTIATGELTAKVDPSAISGANSVGVDNYPSAWSSGILDFQQQVTVGTYDIPVTVSTVQGTQTTLLAAKMLRAQTVPGALNGGATVTFSPNDQTSMQTASFSNVPAGAPSFGVNAAFFTATGASIDLSLSNSPGHFLVMPSGAAQAGDYYLVGAQAFAQGGMGGGVGVQVFTSSSGPEALTFPAVWPYAGPTAAKLPTFNFTYTGFAGSPNLTRSATIGWDQGEVLNQILMVATANYQGQSTTISIPDLSALSGFLTPASSGTNVQWNAGIDEGLGTNAVTPSGVIQNVSVNGTYVAP